MPVTTILKGIRIVDMTTVIFGPYATASLAEMGAEVIKIEQAAGDEARRVGKPVTTRGMGPLHMTLNRGKRSVIWDLKTPKGRAFITRLLARSHVFIHNLRADAVSRLGLDYESIRVIRSDMVYVHCSGFGSKGAYADRGAYDDIIQALSGAASLLPMADGNPMPRYMPMAIADKASGLHAVQAVLGALFYRERTGEGQCVEVPMFETFTHFLLQEHMSGRTFVPPNAGAGYSRQLDPLRHPIKTADGHVAIAPYTDARWVRFFEVVGEGDYLEIHGLTTAKTRFSALDQLQKKMSEVVACKTTAYWLELMLHHDIPVAPINTLDEVFDDPHLASVGFFKKRTHPTEGDYLEMDYPLRFGIASGLSLRPAPLLGEHTADVEQLLDDEII